MNAEVINVVDTLRLSQRALRSDDAEVIASAESTISYLVLHLKYRQAPLPSRLRPHVERVEAFGRNV